MNKYAVPRKAGLFEDTVQRQYGRVSGVTTKQIMRGAAWDNDQITLCNPYSFTCFADPHHALTTMGKMKPRNIFECRYGDAPRRREGRAKIQRSSKLQA